MRKAWLVMLCLLLLCSGLATAGTADRETGKLGFGFKPGLVAGKDYVAGQLIIGIGEGMKAAGVAAAVRNLRGRVVRQIEGALLIKLPSDEAAAAAVQALSMRPDTRFIERNGIVRIPPQPERPLRTQKGAPLSDVRPLSVSSDPLVGYQWHQTVIRKTASLPALSTTPPTVAVIDTGVDYTHPDLAGRVIKGRNCVADNNDPFDDNGHGTHVAGIIAAKAGNGSYGEGVCPNCKILAVKVLASDGTGSWFDIACGMQYARQATTNPPTKVINMSLGGPDSALIANEVAAIKAAGKVLVASAGNDNTTSTADSYPGGDPNTALRVMATEEHDCRAYFSNFSPSTTSQQYNIAAPGWEIWSTLPGGGYGPMSGTSMATPVVAGAAALVWGQMPSLTRNQVVTKLLNTGKATSCGFTATTRRVNVRKAILGTSETAIVGRIADPATGLAPSHPTTPANARLYSGTTQLASDGTNTSGMYEMTGLSAGTGLIIKGDRTGYANGRLRTGIAITSGVVKGPFSDSLPRARASGDITITLDWWRSQPITDTTGCTDSCNGWEFDLVVKTPSGEYITFGNPGSLTSPPYVRYPRDSYDDLVPAETVVIRGIAENGVYRIFADRWPDPRGTDFTPSWTGSMASAQLYNGATPFGAFYANPPSTCTDQEFWHIGDLTKINSSYTWTNRNSCSKTSP